MTPHRPPTPSRARAILTAALTIGLALAAALVPLPATAAAVSDRLLSGQTLASGQHLRAVGSDHTLTVQTDGDVTVEQGQRTLWHTGTAGNPGARLVQQPNGSLEVRSAKDALLWTTSTQSTGARSIIKPDGVLYTINKAGAVAWKNATPGTLGKVTDTDRLLSGGRLLPGESITSPDGQVTLTMRNDGNATLTRGEQIVWQTSTTGQHGAHLTMTSHGELAVVTDAGTTAWTSGSRAPGARLVVKDHARIYVIDTKGQSVWSTTDVPVERVPAVVSLPLPQPLPSINGGTSGARPDGGPHRPTFTTFLSRDPQYVSPDSPAARAAETARTQGREQDAALLSKAANGGTARWLGPQDSTAKVASTVRSYAATAAKAGQTPVFVTYAIPNRDCGNHSAGGFATASEYKAWADAIASGLSGARAIVIVEPDALLHLEKCGNRKERLSSLRHSVEAYAAAGAEVYIDAASSNSYGWSASALRDMALRLRSAGVDSAAGFSVNTSNFQRSDHEVAYGKYLSALLGGAQFVIDTSRNGNGPLPGKDGTVWCNPAGRALGALPGPTNDGPHVANLWIKTVGLSDGTCNGGPAAGKVWDQYLLDLASNARW